MEIKDFSYSPITHHQMQRLFSFLFIFPFLISLSHAEDVEKEFKKTYDLWQRGMANKSYKIWNSITSGQTKREVTNRIYSEKFSFPQEIFNVPFTPPPVADLKLLQAKVSGNLGKAVFFGKVDFGVGGAPTDNLLVVSYIKEGGFWRYARAEYINLSALPEVRSEISSGNLSYLKQPDFNPSPVPYANTVKLDGPVPVIAKVYAFCPGREVQAKVNKVSNHLFQNTQNAQVIIGGGRIGANEMQFSIKTLPGGQKNEPLTVRVYLFSQVQGVKPIKIYEYLVQEKGEVTPTQTVNFSIDQEVLNKLAGK